MGAKFASIPMFLISAFNLGWQPFYLSNGNNTFQWEISSECSSSTDQVTIEVANDITLDIPGDIILHAEIRSPKELENEVGLTEGNIFQGELTMDQLMFNRPIPGFAQYKTPINNLYMCKRVS